MTIQERIWMLDKTEASLLRSYFDNIVTWHEEMDLIVANEWNIVKKDRLLTRSIIRRMIAYYKYSKEYSERKERSLGKEAGTYFEDIVFSPMKALLTHEFGEKLKVSRGQRFTMGGKTVVPDITIRDSKTNDPICLVEIKTWFNMTDWRNMKANQDYCTKKGWLFICITGHVGGEELKSKMQDVYELADDYLNGPKSEYDVKIVHPIEDALEKILVKCKSRF